MAEHCAILVAQGKGSFSVDKAVPSVSAGQLAIVVIAQKRSYNAKYLSHYFKEKREWVIRNI